MKKGKELGLQGRYKQLTPAVEAAFDIPGMARLSVGPAWNTLSEADHKAISDAFGTPKPTLANTYGLELLNLRTFPTLMGYSSRMLAESWESNLLYYAALADQIHAQPAQMNILVPSWTQQTVEHIFATHLEDWPALLRSLRLVGDDVREKARRQTQASNSEVIAR